MTVKSKFTHLTKEEPDPIIKTLTQYHQDQSPNKLDVSIEFINLLMDYYIHSHQ